MAAVAALRLFHWSDCRQEPRDQVSNQMLSPVTGFLDPSASKWTQSTSDTPPLSPSDRLSAALPGRSMTCGTTVAFLHLQVAKSESILQIYIGFLESTLFHLKIWSAAVQLCFFKNIYISVDLHDKLTMMVWCYIKSNVFTVIYSKGTLWPKKRCLMGNSLRWFDLFA